MFLCRFLLNELYRVSHNAIYEFKAVRLAVQWGDTGFLNNTVYSVSLERSSFEARQNHDQINLLKNNHLAGDMDMITAIIFFYAIHYLTFIFCLSLSLNFFMDGKQPLSRVVDTTNTNCTTTKAERP